MVSYQWTLFDSADATEGVPAGTDTSLTIVSTMKGKFVEVAVTDDKGTVFKSARSSEIKEDTANNVTIADVMGLQTDGTGKVDDTLELSYGSSVGTPNSITWYKDDKILATFTDKASSYGPVNGLQIGTAVNAVTPAVPKTDKEGKYWAVVTTADGLTIESNKIELTLVESAAIIKSFAVEDSYGGVTSSLGAVNLTYDSKDTNAVATLVLNKDYVGNVYIFKSNTEKFKTANALGSRAGNGWDTTTGTNTAGKFDLETNPNKMGVDDVFATAVNTSKAKKLVADDGSTTYMWVVGGTTAALVRGESYIAVFDQKNYSGDEIGEGKENKSEAATVPYVKVPERIAITKAEPGVAAEVTLYDSGDTVAAWLGCTTAGTPQDVATDLTVYEDSSNAVSVDSLTKVVGNTAEKGVMKSAATQATSLYFLATVSFDAGVYGEKKVTLTSDKVGAAEEAAAGLKPKYDVKTPTSITAEVTASFKAPGKVELYRNTKGTAWTGATGTAGDNLDNCTKVAEVTVAKGDSKAVFENAVSRIYTEAGGNQYAVVYTPDDTLAYFKTQNVDTDRLEITPTVVSYSMAQKVAKKTATQITAMGSVIKGIDQFGGDVTTNITGLTSVKLDATMLEDTTTTAAGAGTVQIALGGITNAGVLTITTADGTADAVHTATGYVSGTSKTVTLPGGQKLKIACDGTNTTAADATLAITIE